MGILNVTPDSFSDGGLFLQPEMAISHALELVRDGADIIDVGGESTRPGADQVPAEQELERVLPVIESLAASQVNAKISIDTSKGSVAAAALGHGATLVNDVSALRADPEMAQIVASAGAECCLMHMRGEPRTMQQNPVYEDVVDDVKAFLEERMSFAVGEGIDERRLLIDPGIGFGKTFEHNLELLRRLGELTTIGAPILIGTSRKSFLGAIASDRLFGTIATNVLALERGASVFRVHDVAPVRDALATAAATLGSQWTARTTSGTT